MVLQGDMSVVGPPTPYRNEVNTVNNLNYYCCATKMKPRHSRLGPSQRALRGERHSVDKMEMAHKNESGITFAIGRCWFDLNCIVYVLRGFCGGRMFD